eukprot:g33886.t1
MAEEEKVESHRAMHSDWLTLAPWLQAKTNAGESLSLVVSDQVSNPHSARPAPHETNPGQSSSVVVSNPCSALLKGTLRTLSNPQSVAHACAAAPGKDQS